MPTRAAQITRGIVLAAGLGERMRPLTNTVPKPLLRIAGKSLIDHALDRLEDAGIDYVVVNTFYLSEVLEEHLAQRSSPYITISREEKRLETGGGIRRALPHLGNQAFYAVNSDSFWLNGPTNTLERMADIWDEKSMDGLLLLHSTADSFGYTERGDFNITSDSRLIRRPAREISPYLFTGIQILHTRLFEMHLSDVFSLNMIYDRAIKEKRLFGIVHDGEWFHIGTPKGLSETERYMKQRYAEAQNQ